MVGEALELASHFNTGGGYLMDTKRIDVEEFTKAILAGDNERVIQVLDEFGLTKDGIGVLFNLETRALAKETLTFTALKARRGDLADDFARQLIERTAGAVEVFPFLRLVVAYDGCSKSNEEVPKELAAALASDWFDQEMADAIIDLDKETFRALIAYTMGDLDKLCVGYSYPLILCAYMHKIIPAELLFAFLAGCLRERRPALPLEALLLGAL